MEIQDRSDINIGRNEKKTSSGTKTWENASGEKQGKRKESKHSSMLFLRFKFIFQKLPVFIFSPNLSSDNRPHILDFSACLLSFLAV